MPRPARPGISAIRTESVTRSTGKALPHPPTEEGTHDDLTEDLIAQRPRRPACSPPALFSPPASAPASLRVLAWEGYADQDWVKEFTAETGIDVNVVFIGSDDEIWAKIKGSEGKDFDVMAVNTAQLQRYIDAKLVTPWDLANIPNQKEVLPRFRDLDKIRGRDARRQGLRHSVRLRFDRPHL